VHVTYNLYLGLDLCFLDFNDELIGKVFEFVDTLKTDGNASLASILDNVLLTKVPLYMPSLYLSNLSIP